MLPDSSETEAIDKKEIVVAEWVKHFSETGEIRELDAAVIRSVLEAHGAKFVEGGNFELLGKYVNKIKKEGLDPIWGKDLVNSYIDWTSGFVTEYERKSGKKLPRLKNSGSNIAGMLKFLDDLTSFAAGKMGFEEFKKYTEARSLNGRLWQEGKEEDRPRLTITISEKLKTLRPASFPPEFPQAAWDFIKSWKK